MTTATELSTTVESLQIDIGILAFCARHKLLLPLRLSLLTAALNHPRHNKNGNIQVGINRYPKADIIQACIDSGILSRSQVYEAFRINKKAGNPFFAEYTKDGEQWLHIKSGKGFFQWIFNRFNFAIPQLGLAIVPIERVQHKTSREWDRLIYEIYLLTTSGLPISRASIRCAIGISASAQRRFDHEIQVVKSTRWLKEWMYLDEVAQTRDPQIRQLPNVYTVTSDIEIEQNRGWRKVVYKVTSAKDGTELDSNPLTTPIEPNSVLSLDLDGDGVAAPTTLYHYLPSLPNRSYQDVHPLFGELYSHKGSRVMYQYHSFEWYENYLVPLFSSFVFAKNPVFNLGI